MEIVNNTSERRSGESHWIKPQQLVTEEVPLSGALKVTQTPTEPSKANLSGALRNQNIIHHNDSDDYTN